MKIASLAGRIFLLILLMLAFLAGYLTGADSPIDAASYSPPGKPRLTGALTPNRKLQDAELIAAGKIHGAEDVAVDSHGRIYGGAEDGKILRITLESMGQQTIETFAQTGGRPLGLHFDAQGNLIVADAVNGLLSIDPQGAVTRLAREAEGVPFGFTDDPDVASDGIIYFSDASSKFGYGEDRYDLLEAKPAGRLLAYDPASKSVRVLLGDLFFANGVALSQNEDFVLVNETFRYRITRYWLKGPKAGTWDRFRENLPGFPDGISANRRGVFWVALFTVRNDLMDWLHRFPLLKNQMAKLPQAIWPKPQSYGFILALDEQGRIRQSLHDPTGQHVKEITSAQQQGEFLYLGTLHGDWIARYRLRQ